MSNEKTYIGKGKQVKDMDIINCSICIDDLMKDLDNLTHEYEGKKYLSFSVAKLKSADQWGKTHTIYVRKLQPEEA